MVASSLGRAHVCAWFFGGLGMLFLLGGALVARTPVLEQSNADVPVAASDTEAPTPATPAWAARHLLATSASTTQSPPSSRDPASAATSLRARSLPQPGSLRSLATTLAPATVVARTLRPAIDEGGFPLLHHGVRALGGAASELVGSSRFVDRAVGAIYGRDRARSYDTVDTVPTRAPLTIIYHVKPFHWTWHLDHWLSGLGRPIRMIVDPGATKFVDHSIVVVNHLSVKHTARYFAEVAKLGLRHVGAFHTGDIDFDQNYEWYKQVRPPTHQPFVPLLLAAPLPRHAAPHRPCRFAGEVRIPEPLPHQSHRAGAEYEDRPRAVPPARLPRPRLDALRHLPRIRQGPTAVGHSGARWGTAARIGLSRRGTDVGTDRSQACSWGFVRASHRFGPRLCESTCATSSGT